MLIAARESFAVASRRRLPYDAEISYLESTGTQWIDTGLIGRDGYDFEYRVLFTSVGSSANVVGGEYTDGSSSTAARSLYLGLVRTNGYLSYHYDGTSSPVEVQAVQANRVYSIVGHMCSGSQYMEVDGVRGGVGTLSDSFVAQRNIYLFAINFSPPTPGYLKLYNCTISRNGETLRDMIPVRFTNELGQSEGAMYDRRGTGGMNPDGSARTDGLYRNRGAGAFTIGPDIN